MKRLGIIGFGRFGKVLYQLLKKDFKVLVYDRDSEALKAFKFLKKDRAVKKVKEVYDECETISYAVPISKFERVIKSQSKYFKKNHLLVDVLSVKVHPYKVFEKELKNLKVQALLTHPMFGPDSSKQGFKNLPIVLDKFKTSNRNYNFWKKFFKGHGLRVVEMTAKKHDEMAADSQGVTHFLGRLLNEFQMKPTAIDTLGAQKLHEVQKQTCQDTWQLFKDLQNYNPYTKKMRIKIGKAYNKVYGKLLPRRVNEDYLVFGIQGGKGSFNEEALTSYVRECDLTKKDLENIDDKSPENKKDFIFYKTKYLYTTKKVLTNLHKGNIDYGLFAIENSVGGLVEESIKAMAEYRFKILAEHKIKIRHFLMKRKDAKKSDIKVIMTHPQVLKQCKKTLAKKYLRLKLKSGRGDLIDHAKVAEYLSKKKLPKSIAVMGSQILTKLYNLDVIDKDLQDDKENFTSFLVVKR